jgi:hypothetical protein
MAGISIAVSMVPTLTPAIHAMSAIDAVDGSSTRHVSAMDVGAVKAPTKKGIMVRRARNKK